MRIKLLGVLASLFLLTGCSGDNIDTGDTSSTGEQQASTPVGGIVTGSHEDLVVNIGDRIFFDFDRSDLRPDAIDTLSRQADWMKANPSVIVAIEGHCDERGTREYNLALGDRRASTARQYLESMGIARGRMDTISYGKERPEVLGSNEAAWAQNRRAVMIVKSGPAS
jgi:peptidoglycan-associated lipoprotein